MRRATAPPTEAPTIIPVLLLVALSLLRFFEPPFWVLVGDNDNDDVGVDGKRVGEADAGRGLTHDESSDAPTLSSEDVPPTRFCESVIVNMTEVPAVRFAFQTKGSPGGG